LSSNNEHDKRRIGCFLCRCGGNISDVVDLDQLKEFTEQLDDVQLVEINSFTCSAEGQANIQAAIKSQNLDGVMIGACTPRQYEEMFRETIQEAGLNPFTLEIVNLREQCSYPHFHEREQALHKAKLLVRGAAEKARRLIPLPQSSIRISTDTAVIGAGIAGIHAASTLAALGHKVHLIERQASVGGNMARVVKIFPTDDCALCTLSPRMDEVNKNSKINLLTHTEIEHISKLPEGLAIRVKKKPRYVIAEDCTGCGKCTEVCPVDVYNDYNKGLRSTRKAAYRTSPSAVPNTYLLDKRGIPPCREGCPIFQNPQGYATLIAAGQYQQALALIRRDNPLPSVCGRVCPHPCEDQCSRELAGGPLAIAALKRFVMEHPANAADLQVAEIEKKPAKVAVIGGGPSGLACAHDLALAGIDVKVFEAAQRAGGVPAISLPNYRLPANILQRDIDYIERLGVAIETGSRVSGTALKQYLRDYDAVLVAVGLHKDKFLPVPGSELAGVLRGGEYLRDVKLGHDSRAGNKIVVIGGGNVAMDVARTALRSGAEVQLICLETKAEMPAIRSEIQQALEEGVVMHPRASPKRFMEKNGRVGGVEFLAVERIDFDELGRMKPVIMERSESIIKADTVIFAIGQEPDVADLFEGLDVELTPFGTIATDPETLQSSVPGLYAGGDAVTGPTTIVEAMAFGKKAARCIADAIGYPIEDLDVYPNLDVVPMELAWDLAQKAGDTSQPRTTTPMLPMADRRASFAPVEQAMSEAQAIAEANRCLQCGGCSDCRLCDAACEAKAIQYDQVAETEELIVGGVVVATGFKDYDPSKLLYGYDRYENVITQFQLARMLDPMGPTEGKVLRPSDGRTARKIVMVQCVGSRGDAQGNNDMHAYCSRVCCMVALKHAGLIKKNLVTDAEIYICYIDIRAFGKGYEEYYERTRNQGIHFIRGLPGRVTENSASRNLLVTVDDQLTGSLLNIDADLVVLSTAMEPADDVDTLIKQLGIQKDESGFIKEFHLKIRPTDTSIKNVMIAGTAQGPKDITDSIAQAGSAAASLAGYIGDGEVLLNPQTAYIHMDRCRACGRCEEACEFSAVNVAEGALWAVVEAALCEGCGKCTAICPTGAIGVHSAEVEQIEAMISGYRNELAEQAE
jgi:heterodisulfide reductase subunit A|tara:strand:+ start:4168 stop:7587 length:3420 start_codon:yes stop_codon:yes gene_type:complete